MPSDPPAVPHRDQACPAQAGRAAPGGFLGPITARLCLVLLLLSGFVPGLIPGHGATALAAPAATPERSNSALSGPGVSPPVVPAPRPLQKELLAAVPANLPPLYVPAADGGPGGFAVELLRRVVVENPQAGALAGQEQLVVALSWIFPNLSLFDKKYAAAYGMAFSGQEFLLLCLYSISYSALLIYLATLLFKRKELA